MSKYPDNPWWDHANDRPNPLMTKEQWEQADADGHITPEHVLFRLRNILVFAMGNPGPVGYDEDGHVISLVGASIQLEGGVKLRVCSRDHNPPHVHIEHSDFRGQKLRVNLVTGEFIDTAPRGLKTTKMKGYKRAIVEPEDRLKEMWVTAHGEYVFE
ncbi:DUF4160 domain-containing protein [Rhodococcus sp. ABRD24]|uniref:DUF4160 domain-containing protein n=1 Tax=Rhodococcus sp. ABRD24 TaxID=2507582 RepID=UPI00103E4176|nr:DUF4160 domain-containing protein [Rhodococcus sp. ABRD24]QBJ94578.1 DUF4160 domain-containing protein [Rhodococcus sp. ABRD24]